MKYGDNYSKTSVSLWQYDKDDTNDNTTQSESFKSKIKITGQTPAAGDTKDVEIIAPLKYLSNFWRTLEMPLINFEVNLILKWSSTRVVIYSATGEAKFKITDTKLYVPVVTLSTQDNVKLLQQLKSGFKRIISWNKYQSNPKIYSQTRYLNDLADPIFQGVDTLFVLSFENEDDKTSRWTYYLPKVEMKDYNVTIHSKNLFDQPIYSNLKTYKNIRKIAAGQGADCTTDRLLDYLYF